MSDEKNDDGRDITLPPEDDDGVFIEFVDHEDGKVVETAAAGDIETETPVTVDAGDTTAAPPPEGGTPEELEEQLLRLRADFENYRKRMARDRENQRTTLTGEILSELLPILDNFSRAVEQLPEEAGESWGQGFALLLKQLLEILGEMGLKEIEAEGQPFDPAYHEALGTIPTEGDAPPNQVLQVTERGYLHHGKLLRPARVLVSRAEEPPPAEGGEDA